MKSYHILYCISCFFAGYALGGFTMKAAVEQQQPMTIVIHKHYTYPLQPDQCGCVTDAECEGIEEVECE